MTQLPSLLTKVLETLVPETEQFSARQGCNSNPLEVGINESMTTRAVNEPSRSFTIMEKTLSRAFSLMEAH